MVRKTRRGPPAQDPLDLDNILQALRGDDALVILRRLADRDPKWAKVIETPRNRAIDRLGYAGASRWSFPRPPPWHLRLRHGVGDTIPRRSRRLGQGPVRRRTVELAQEPARSRDATAARRVLRHLLSRVGGLVEPDAAEDALSREVSRRHDDEQMHMPGTGTDRMWFSKGEMQGQGVDGNGLKYAPKLPQAQEAPTGLGD